MKISVFLIIFLLFISIPLFALTEEEIFVEGTDMLLRYSLSNDLQEIERAIQNRTDFSISLSNIAWVLNPELSISVKNLMNRLNLNYSMTTWNEGIYRYVIVNRRVGNNWFIYQYTLFDS